MNPFLTAMAQVLQRTEINKSLRLTERSACRDVGHLGKAKSGRFECQEKTHININRFRGLSMIGFGCVFGGSFPMGKNTQTKIPRKSVDKPVELLFFFGGVGVVCWFFFQ